MFSALFAFSDRFLKHLKHKHLHIFFFIDKKEKKCQKCYTVAEKTTLEKKHYWTNNSQQHCVIQIVIEKLAVHSKSQERAKKISHFWAWKNLHDSRFWPCKVSTMCNREIVLDCFCYLCGF